MKKIFKIAGIVLIVLILAAVALPFLFKGKIVSMVKEEINKSVNAKVDIQGFGLTLFRSFPDFSLSLDKLTVVGIKEFEKDTLANIASLHVSVDLFSVFRGDNYKITAIHLKNPKFLLKVTKDGKANWDIAKPSSAPAAGAPAEPSHFKMTLDKVRITDASLVYDDASLNTRINLRGLDHTLSGDMTGDLTRLKTRTDIKKLTVDYGGVRYLRDAKATMVSEIEADLKAYKFTFSGNEINLNDLALGVEGWFAMPDEGYRMDLKFKARKNEFRNFLSMVPAIYTKDFDKVKTSGTLALDGFVKGLYNDNSMPAFGVNLKIAGAMFQYPDLPQSVKNINMDASVKNGGKGADDTEINVSRLHLEMAGNPVDITLQVKTPVSDAQIEGSIRGQLDLGKVKQFYPLPEGDELSGLFRGDVALKGRMSSVEKEKYQDFTARGNLLVKGLNYKSKDFPDGILVNNADLHFTPAFLELAGLAVKIGKNDLSASGKVDNYLGYFFKEDLLKGSFTVTSSYFNLDDLMASQNAAGPAEKGKKEPAAPDTATLSVIRVPENLDFVLTSAFNKLIYDKTEMKDVRGMITIRKGTVSLDGLRMNVLDGQLGLKGSYSTHDRQEPFVDFDIQVSSLDIPTAFKTFVLVRKLAPIAGKVQGRASAGFTLKTSLDQHMMPVYSTMAGEGSLTTGPVRIQGVNALGELANTLKLEKFKSFTLDKVALSFSFSNGRVAVKPFTAGIGKVSANIAGSTGFDQSIDYSMNLNIPRSELGSQANAVMNNLAAQAAGTGIPVKLGDNVKVDVKMTGTLDKPVIKTSLGGTQAGLKETVKEAATQFVDQKKAEAEAKAKAEIEKAKLEAEAKAKAEADKLRKEAADKVKAEKEKAKKELEKQLKDKLKNPFK